MSEVIDGNVITEARTARKDVTILPGQRGGLEFRVLSYIDVLRENDIITDSQKDCGYAYWRLKDLALPFLQAPANPIFNEMTYEEEALDAEASEDSIEGATTEIFILLQGRLLPQYRKALDACCSSLETSQMACRMAIIWAYGENLLRWAFTELEEHLPKASREFEDRIKKSLAAE